MIQELNCSHDHILGCYHGHLSTEIIDGKMKTVSSTGTDAMCTVCGETLIPLVMNITIDTQNK